jgi:hypothetical protein
MSFKVRFFPSLSRCNKNVLHSSLVKIYKKAKMCQKANLSTNQTHLN